jgi:hypothetical protein
MAPLSVSSRLSRRHLRFLLIDEVLVSTIGNFAINGAIAWCAFRKATSVPLWGSTSLAADTVATAFILPVVTALLASVVVRAQVIRAMLPPLPPVHLARFAWSGRSPLQRGALVGAASIFVAAAPVVAGFALFGPAQLTTAGFIWFKASFAAALGAVVTPLLGWWALQDASRSPERP